MEELQAFRQALLTLSTSQLTDLLVEKASLLLTDDFKKNDGIRFHRLLQEVGDVTELLKIKKLQEETEMHGVSS